VRSTLRSVRQRGSCSGPSLMASQRRAPHWKHTRKAARAAFIRRRAARLHAGRGRWRDAVRSRADDVKSSAISCSNLPRSYRSRA
jgi:hypothetical protein